MTQKEYERLRKQCHRKKEEELPAPSFFKLRLLAALLLFLLFAGPGQQILEKQYKDNLYEYLEDSPRRGEWKQSASEAVSVFKQIMHDGE